ncbi:MAG: T9SS type A sorting domain-containing protein, partial [Chitinophagales bacterium]
DYWVIKLSSNGIQQFEKNYGGADKDIAYGIVQSADGNYLVVGASQSSNVDVSDNNGNDDFWIVRIDNPLARYTAVEEFIPTTLNVFPNPVVNTAIIESTERMQSITVISLQGKTIEEKMVNSNESTIDMQAFASGLYLLKVVFESNRFEIIQVVKN